MEMILQANDLRKTFTLSKKQQQIEKTKQKTRVAVDGLSFSVKRGEIYGLLGPNGAGKTTTLRILSTLMKPDAGDATLDGFSVVSQPEQVRSKIGFLTSELRPDEFFTPNYLFDFFSELQGVPTQVRDERKKSLFERFGISDFCETVSMLRFGFVRRNHKRHTACLTNIGILVFLCFQTPDTDNTVITVRLVSLDDHRVGGALEITDIVIFAVRNGTA